jgi:DNA-directed RNA polymerase specialized sigma24 family protein
MDATTLESTTSLGWGTRFRTTRWSVVLAAASGGEHAQAAWAELYRTYFRPLVGLIAPRRGHQVASELAHEFFVNHLFDAQNLTKLQRRPDRRFRGWLSETLRNFLVSQWRFERRKCRDVRRNLALGGDDEEQTHPVSCLVGNQADPEWQAERNRALALLSDVLRTLEREYCQRACAGGVDGARRFELAKRVFLPGADYKMLSLDACASELGIGVDAAKHLVGRLRKRYLALRDRELRRRISSDLEEAKRWLNGALERPRLPHAES